MTKYIDVEKLIAEIERRYHKAVDESKYINSAKFVRNELENLREFAYSLQQEQPDLPGIEEPGIPGKDYIPVDWVDACEMYGKWKIVKQEQPKDVSSEIAGYFGEDLPFEDERTKAAYHFFSQGRVFELKEIEEERKRHIKSLIDNYEKGMKAAKRRYD